MIYGNPSHEAVIGIQQSTLLRELIQTGAITPLLNLPMPSEDVTRQELLYLLELQNSVDSIRMAHIDDCEWDLYGVMSRFLASYGIDAPSALIEQQLNVFDPIENYLKVKYNRARPFQMAAYFNIPLYPLLKTDASSSSYPSGHTLTCLWFRHLYMKTYPHLQDDLMDFVLDVKKTREDGGVHYPSDGLFSFMAYKHLRKFI